VNTRTLFRCRHEPAAGTMALPGAGLALAAFLLIGAAGPVGAQQAGVSSRTTAPAASTPAQVAAAGEGDVLTLGVGTSKVVEYGSTLARVSIGDPDVADAVVVSAREVDRIAWLESRSLAIGRSLPFHTFADLLSSWAGRAGCQRLRCAWHPRSRRATCPSPAPCGLWARSSPA